MSSALQCHKPKGHQQLPCNIYQNEKYPMKIEVSQRKISNENRGFPRPAVISLHGTKMDDESLRIVVILRKIFHIVQVQTLTFNNRHTVLAMIYATKKSFYFC